MNMKKTIIVLLMLSILVGCQREVKISVDGLNELEDRVKLEYSNVDNIEFFSMVMHSGFFIYVDKDISYEEALPIFEIVREFYINNGNAINDKLLSKKSGLEDIFIEFKVSGRNKPINTLTFDSLSDESISGAQYMNWKAYRFYGSESELDFGQIELSYEDGIILDN